MMCVPFHYVMSFPIILSLLRIFARRENQLSELFLSPIIVARNNNRITVSKITKMKKVAVHHEILPFKLYACKNLSKCTTKN